jgi:MFS family permease
MALVTLAITILIAIDWIAIWHLFAASLITGMISSFMMPARQAFIVELVEEKDYLNAVSLGSMAMNACRIASPALAGVLIKMIGIPGIYWIVSVSYLCVILTTTRIPPGELMTAKADAPIMGDILEGLRYVKNNRIIISLLIMGFVPMLLVMPYQMLMPVFARDIFMSGETGLGILMSTSGIGALVGSVVIASMGDYQRKGLLMLISGAFFGLFLVPFATAGSLMPAAVFLVFVGASSSIFMALNNTLVMSHTPNELIGRVMSVFMMTFGLMPLGTIFGGALAEVIGAPVTVAGGGIILVLFLTGVGLTQPTIRQLR